MNKILFISIIFLLTSCVHFKKNQPSKVEITTKGRSRKINFNKCSGFWRITNLIFVYNLIILRLRLLKPVISMYPICLSNSIALPK